MFGSVIKKRRMFGVLGRSCKVKTAEYAVWVPDAMNRANAVPFPL